MIMSRYQLQALPWVVFVHKDSHGKLLKNPPSMHRFPAQGGTCVAAAPRARGAPGSQTRVT